jgi:hypothetical protein
MKQATDNFHKHWRDIALAMIATFVIGSFALIAYGINQNNKLAAENKTLAADAKQHIDCIIKDFETPIPPGAASRYITKVNTDCDIKFVAK